MYRHCKFLLHPFYQYHSAYLIFVNHKTFLSWLFLVTFTTLKVISTSPLSQLALFRSSILQQLLQARLQTIFLYITFSSGLLASYFSFHMPIYICINKDRNEHTKKQKETLSVKTNTQLQQTVKIYKNSRRKKVIASKHQMQNNTNIFLLDLKLTLPHYNFQYLRFVDNKTLISWNKN